ncbi:DUF4402 domain-containing protein [bacterium]|nr:DUF4402 domain-containing protein [bacterium]
MRHLHTSQALRVCAIVVLSVLLWLEPASAQNVVVNEDLIFSYVYPGVPKEIDKSTAGSAAEFLITGTAGDEVSITFTLPSYMSQSGYTMQVLFPQTSCALDSSSVPDQSSPPVDDLDPYDVITYRLGSAGLTVWLGGKVIPKLAQPPGDYTADIVITVAYTGL